MGDFRKRGLGMKMIRVLIDLARKQGLSILIAEVLAEQTKVVKAFEMLDQAMKEQPDKAARQQLAFVSVSLPLEIDASDYAEERLRICRSEISDPLLIEYFEARILYLKDQHHKHH